MCDRIYMIEGQQGHGAGGTEMKKGTGNIGIMNSKDRDTIMRLVLSLVFVVPLAIVSWIGPGTLMYLVIKYVFLIPIIIANRRIFVRGFTQMASRSAESESLIAVAAAASILIIRPDVAGLILTLTTLSEFIDSKIAARTGETLETLLHENETLDAKVSQTSEKIDRVFVPVVVSAAAVTMLIWFIAVHNVVIAALAGIAVLVVACPGALELAAPAAFTVGLEKGAENGILFNRISALEQAYKVDTVVLDKTGTITIGNPEVTDVIALDDDFSLLVAAGIEKYSAHPIAKAIVSEALNKPGVIPEPVRFEEIPGRGVQTVIRKRTYIAGNRAFMEAKGIEPEFDTGSRLASRGKIVVYFAELETDEAGRTAGGDLIGIVALRDGPKPTSLRAVSMIENMGIDVIMLTGDNYATSEAIKKEVGIDRAIAQVLPQDKDKVIAEIQGEGDRLVAMVGDSINDAPAIAKADVGIALGPEDEPECECADVVLLHDDLTYVARTITLSRSVMSKVRQNFMWAVGYNIVGILIAAGVLMPLLGWTPGPVIAMVLMCLSPLLVMLNSLRLKRIKLYQK